MEFKDCYVYLHISLKSGVIFYIGKGSGRRAKSKKQRNSKWHEIVKSEGYKIEYFKTQLTDLEAFNLEAELIQQYKDSGHLTNIMDGQLGPTKGSNRGPQANKQYRHTCIDCKNRLKNIYAKRCQNCRNIYKKTDEYRKICSESQKLKYKDPEQRRKCASRFGISPANKGLKTGKPSWQTGRPISEEAKQKMRETRRKNKEAKDANT